MNESITIGLVEAAITVAGVVVGCIAVGYGWGFRDGKHQGYLDREIEEQVKEMKRYDAFENGEGA